MENEQCCDRPIINHLRFEMIDYDCDPAVSVCVLGEGEQQLTHEHGIFSFIIYPHVRLQTLCCSSLLSHFCQETSTDGKLRETHLILLI